jgi:hypothetical protein
MATTIRGLDHLSYAHKLRHWLRADAWEPAGNKLRFKNPEVSRSAVLMDGGDVIRMPLLVGRPCFGIATAYLRYRDHTRYVKGRGRLPAGRCHQCNAKDACHYVVFSRLAAHPEIAAARAEWAINDGTTSFNKPNFRQLHVAKLWAKLCRALSRHPFQSSNDKRVVEAYAEADNEALEQDRRRKAAQRIADRAKGIVDEADMAALEQAQRVRRADLAIALMHPEAPKALARLPEQSINDLLDVWLGRATLRLRQEKANAPSIARWIVETGRRNQSKNHAALASRVVKDLERIAVLEQTRWERGLLIAPLDEARELPSKIPTDDAQ